MQKRTLSEETKRKISETQKGKPRSPRSEETKRKISIARKGHPVSDYVKQRASETHKGKVTSQETKNKMRASHAKASYAKTNRPVKITDTETGVIYIFMSMKQATEEMHFGTPVWFIVNRRKNNVYRHYTVELLDK